MNVLNLFLPFRYKNKKLRISHPDIY